jgi:hypothetical protein
LGVEGAAALAASRGLRGLTRLYLTGNGIGPEGAMALAASTLPKQWELLKLWGNDIGEPDALAIRQSPTLGGVKNPTYP